MTSLQQILEIHPGEVLECPLSLAYEMTALPGSPVLPFSTAEILFEDGQGISYRSSTHVQAQDARFLIINSEEYNPNSLGDPTRLLSLDIACSLFQAGGGPEIQFRSADFQIAAAFPRQ